MQCTQTEVVYVFGSFNCDDFGSHLAKTTVELWQVELPQLVTLPESMWKWCDIRPSMVTHTQNLCSAINPHKVCAHTAVNTHTHTRSSGQPFMLRRLGSSWGFGALLKGTSVELSVERALYIHSPHLQFLPARDLNSQLLDYESDFLIIRARLSPTSGPGRWWCPGTWMTPLQSQCCSWWWVGGEQGGFSWRPRSSPQFWVF